MKKIKFLILQVQEHIIIPNVKVHSRFNRNPSDYNISALQLTDFKVKKLNFQISVQDSMKFAKMDLKKAIKSLQTQID